ncbi:hypothetical protein DFR55_101374 [Herbinix hemicellulosilytica]|uniref:Uncharacterized protein n=1 Tax=Herbinix hemicellulosilytica TaxID=1564487 RepID=A0A0H5SWA5_HERHM|nr:hypothetical protein DFR55_101374 [Herbinix hemicellulosilytica]CRZ34608.1 hypothetical protein HHT355_1407 [Herbinix hemicellulosilytica]
MPVFGYRPSRKSNILRPGQPVCVAVVYNVLAEFRPVAFGVELNGMRYRYKISRVNAYKDNYGAIIFDCEYNAFGCIIPVRLVFNVFQGLWLIG